VDGKIYPLGGNMRFKALKELNYKDIPDNWVTLADDWTEEKRREFVIKDNVGFGEWDWEQLANDWDSEELEAWGLDVPNFGSDESEEKEQKDLSDELKETFEVIITCGNETEQEATFEYLTKKGYICRVLTL
jgi:hypothetical protein